MAITGPFEILEVLGEGSFGTVCVARVNGDPLRRRVALKILKATYAKNRKVLNRTRDEARLLARINHPNVVRVERLMDLAGRPVVVMEHVPGVSLGTLLHRFREGLPPAIAIECIRQTCLALHAAYNEARGDDGEPLHVIHRDIKPSNVLLSVHGEVKVVDFGIAKGNFEGREANTESVVMGSRPYMSPERLDGVADSPAVDVYSAGMSLFELLTGHTMSVSINPIGHDRMMNDQLADVTLQGVDPKITADLRAVVRRMCAYDRDYRPTALEAADELEQVYYAVPREERITLAEFAKSTVLPIYEGRSRKKPAEALDSLQDAEFLGKLTGGAVASRTTSDLRRRLTSRAAVFAFGLSGAIVLLGSMVAVKMLRSEASASAPSADDGQVAVKVVLPADARATIGSKQLAATGEVRVERGRPTTMMLDFDDGRHLRCAFTATGPAAVRVVLEKGTWGLSVDDAPGLPCRAADATGG